MGRGMISFSHKGNLKTWDNRSGHYLPSGGFAENASKAHPDLPIGNFVRAHRGNVTRPDGRKLGPQLPVVQPKKGEVLVRRGSSDPEKAPPKHQANEPSNPKQPTPPASAAHESTAPVAPSAVGSDTATVKKAADPPAIQHPEHVQPGVEDASRKGAKHRRMRPCRNTRQAATRLLAARMVPRRRPRNTRSLNR